MEELHIQIDLLLQSEPGVDMLREKLALLVYKLEFERMLHNDLEEQYFMMENNINYRKKLEQEIKLIKEAS